MEGLALEQKPADAKSEKKTLTASDLFLTALFPHIAGKVMLLYFGINYAERPGEGYGYGLAFAICLSVVLVARFLYRSRNYED